MKLFRNLALGLFTAALTVSMLTACGASAPPASSEPSAPSNPGTSQGGTDQTPENPGGGSETPPGGDEGKPNETPAQKSWATSLTKAYLDSLGVTSENYRVYNTNYAATVLFYYDGNVVDGDNDFYLDLAVHGSKRLEKQQSAGSSFYGFYTDGQNYYVLDSNKWQQITRTEIDPFYDYTSTIDADFWLDLFLGSSFVPAASDIEDFQVTTTTSGVTETVTMKNKTVCTYLFDAEHKLTEIRSKGPEYKYQELSGGGVEIQMKNPTFEKASQSAVFPTTFSDKPYQWTDDSETKDLPKTWADSKTNAYLTKNGITKEAFYIEAEDSWTFGKCTCEFSGNSKSVLFLKDGTFSGYAYNNGVYSRYGGTETAPALTELSSEADIAAAKAFFEKIEAFATIPSNVEVTAFRAYQTGYESFITTNGTLCSVRLNSNGEPRRVRIDLPNGDDVGFDIEVFKRSSVAVTSSFDLLTLVMNLF